LGNAAPITGRIGDAATVASTMTVTSPATDAPTASTPRRAAAASAPEAATSLRSNRSASVPPSSEPATSAAPTAVISIETATTDPVSW
jgi:hypothetical protein